MDACKFSMSVLLSLATMLPASAAEVVQGEPPQAHVSEAQVQAAIVQLERLAQTEIDANAVPGLAIGVVHNDKLIYAKGFGVRVVGQDAKIDAETAFQLASCSKPIGAAVIAGLIGDGKITWDSKISDLDPEFKMYDPWVTGQITIRDFYSHRSGLPEHAGDLLEDLGGDRALVLHQLRYQKPDSSFRSAYAYTNFGITEAAVAAAKANGLSWEDASEQKLYKPLGMTATSSRYSDFHARTNKALGHVLVNGKWVQKYNRQPDAQSPAGGVSSSINDLAKWMRLEIANGKFDGKQIVNEKALVESHHPQMLTQFSPQTQLPGFYGLGINVGYDQHGRLRLGHSGAFALGAGTCVTMVPNEQLGIVVLTNAYPIGLAEGLAQEFTDLALTGATEDWIARFKKVFADPATLGIVKGFDFSKAPGNPAPASPRSAYLGTYASDFFGNVDIIENNNTLAMVLGPRRMTVPIKHYNRDTFTYETTGENAGGTSGITFALDAGGTANQVVVDHLNEHGEGTFKRVSK